MRKLWGGFLVVLLVLGLFPAVAFAGVGEEEIDDTNLWPAAMPATREYPALLPSFEAGWYTRANRRILHSKYDFFFLAAEMNSDLSSYSWRNESFTLYYGWDGSLYPIMENVSSICGGWGGWLYLTLCDPAAQYPPEGFQLVRYNPVTGYTETVMENVYRALVGPETGGLMYYTTTHPAVAEHEEGWPDYRFEIRVRNLASGMDEQVFEDEGNDALYDGDGVEMALSMEFDTHAGKLYADVYYPYPSEGPLTRTLWLKADTGEILGDSIQVYREAESFEEKVAIWNTGGGASRLGWDTRYEAEEPANPYLPVQYQSYWNWYLEEGEQSPYAALLNEDLGVYFFRALLREGAEESANDGPLDPWAWRHGPFVFAETPGKTIFVFDTNLRNIYVANPDDALELYAAPGWRVG